MKAKKRVTSGEVSREKYLFGKAKIKSKGYA
jgi:hypothetical protein